MTKQERSELIQRLYEESDPGTFDGLDQLTDEQLVVLIPDWWNDQ